MWPGIGGVVVGRIRNSHEYELAVKCVGAARGSQYDCRDRILGRLRRAAELSFLLDTRRLASAEGASGCFHAKNERQHEVTRV